MTLNHGQVSFRGVRVVTDTSFDLDSLPDLKPLGGYIDFIPSRSTNYDKGNGTLVVIQPVTAGLDASGVMRDGQSNQTVTLVSPLSPDLLYQDWTWLARFRLTNANIEPVVFNLAVGQTKNLANEAKLMSLVVEVSSTFLVINGDGTVNISGLTITDNDDGTFTANDNALADNGDGTYTLTA